MLSARTSGNRVWYHNKRKTPVAPAHSEFTKSITNHITVLVSFMVVLFLSQTNRIHPSSPGTDLQGSLVTTASVHEYNIPIFDTIKVAQDCNNVQISISRTGKFIAWLS